MDSPPVINSVSVAAIGMKIWVDGGGDCDNHPARIAIVYEYGLKKEIHEVGKLTNTEAELVAIIYGLEVAHKRDMILSDSQVSIHAQRYWNRVRKKSLIPLIETVRLLAQEKECELRWIPRHDNKAGKVLNTMKKREQRTRKKWRARVKTEKRITRFFRRFKRNQ